MFHLVCLKKQKKSKLLVRSFRHIYKVAGFGIATGLSGLFSLSQLQRDVQIPTDDSISNRGVSSLDDSAQNFESSKFLSSDDPILKSAPMAAESEHQMDFDVSVDLKEESLEVANAMMSSDEIITTTSDLFLPLLLITTILSGFTIYYLYKFYKKSK